MKKLSFLLVLLAPVVLAQVDTKDGTAITTSGTFDGVSTVDTADGQAIKVAAGGPTVDEDFTSCSNMTNIGNTVTCASGLASGSYNYGHNTAYSNTSLSTANHYAEIDGIWNDATPDLASAIVRCDGNTTSSVGYYAVYNNSGSNISVTLYRFSGTTHTYISGSGTITGQSVTAGNRYLTRLTVNSSNQFSFWVDADDDGTFQADEKAANFVTDTTYTGGTYVGVNLSVNSGSTVNADLLQGDDI